MIKDKQSKTFYRDGVQMTTEDENIIDTLAATLGFGPKYKPTVTPKYECPKCHKIVAYYKAGARCFYVQSEKIDTTLEAGNFRCEENNIY